MEHEYWLEKWRNADTFWHQKSINQYLMQYIDKLDLQAGESILVPLCGKTKDMLWLADRGYHVVGVELSRLACEAFFHELQVEPTISTSGKLIKYSHNNIEIYCGDIFDIDAAQLTKIKAIFDCRALVALPPDMRKKYVYHLQACTGKMTRTLLLTIESSCQVSGPPFSIDQKEVSQLFGHHFQIEHLKRDVCEKIPPHLIGKGYLDMSECAYLLVPKRANDV